jgi:hypothetical protein
MAKFEAEQEELKSKQVEMRRALNEQRQRHDESKEFMALIKTYRDVTKRNAPILNELIDKIEVGAIAHGEDGVKRRVVRIRYRQYCYVEIFNEESLFRKMCMVDEAYNAMVKEAKEKGTYNPYLEMTDQLMSEIR